MSHTVPFTLSRYEGERFSAIEDEVAAEEPLEIRVEGHTVAILMRTPGHDRELAAGFLLTEGIVASRADIFDLTSCVPSETGKGNVVDVALRNPASFRADEHARSGFSSASCGLCGKLSIEAVLRKAPPIDSSLTVSARVLLSLPGALMPDQTGFQRSGGLHACALFTREGTLIQAREDIGRHNALDKLIGWALLTDFASLPESIVLFSGRTSFEMMQKALAARIPIVAAISAPSSLAVSLARESGQTLAGFVRGETMNVYSAPERITTEP